MNHLMSLLVCVCQDPLVLFLKDLATLVERHLHDHVADCDGLAKEVRFHAIKIQRLLALTQSALAYSLGIIRTMEELEDSPIDSSQKDASPPESSCTLHSRLSSHNG